MKNLILILLLTTSLFAEQRSVVWTKNPESDVVSYTLSYWKGELKKEITTDKTTITLDLDPGEWSFRLVATNDEGTNSQPSDIVVHKVLKPAPSQPAGLKIIKIQIEGSNDQIKWKDIAIAYPEKKWKYTRIKS